MPSVEEREHIERLMKVHRRNLALLEMQAANYGGEASAPLHIVNQLDAVREEIKKLEARLADHSTSTK